MRNELSLLSLLSLLSDCHPLRNIFFNDDWDDLMGLSSKETSLPLDYEEKDDRFLIGIDMPGVGKNDVNIELDKNCLIVKANRKEEIKKKHYTEKKYGSFQRVIKMPDSTQSDKITAKFENGVLKLDIPKGESAKAKVIPIR